MSDFLQLHLLTSYPPANPNRDDLGRPKTAMMGGAMRMRISSQSLKRAWRTSSVFQEALSGHIGTRTRELGLHVHARLVEHGVADGKAFDWAKKIAEKFGKAKGKGAKEGEALAELEIEQLAHVGPQEWAAVDALADTLAQENRAPTEEDLALLRKAQSSVDIALFGRMLAAQPAFNIEAAAQVAHAISVHPIVVEDDFFTAVDDLNDGTKDLGAGHMGDSEFATGLFYLYICIDRGLLVRNLDGDSALAAQALGALAEAVATVTPGGKQASYASRAFASYILAERGTQQPRSLSVSFLRPITRGDFLRGGIEALEETRTRMEQCYGPAGDAQLCLNTLTGEGSLDGIKTFVAEGLHD